MKMTIRPGCGLYIALAFDKSTSWMLRSNAARLILTGRICAGLGSANADRTIGDCRSNRMLRDPAITWHAPDPQEDVRATISGELKVAFMTSYGFTPESHPGEAESPAEWGLVHVVLSVSRRLVVPISPPGENNGRVAISTILSSRIQFVVYLPIDVHYCKGSM